MEPGFPRLNNNAEVRSQLLASFVGGFLPSSRHLQDGKDTNILKTLPELCGNSPLLDRALLSLSSAFLAKQHNDDRLLGYSTKLYNNSMEIMHGKIKSGKGLGQDVLYTTVVFQLYEVSVTILIASRFFSAAGLTLHKVDPLFPPGIYGLDSTCARQ